MAVSDSGSWKLFIYPLIILFVIGGIVSLVMTPLIQKGVSSPAENPAVTNIASYVQNGIDINITIPIVNYPITTHIFNIFGILGTSGQNFIVTQLQIFFWLPDFIRIPLEIILAIAFIYAIYVLLAMLIP